MLTLTLIHLTETASKLFLLTFIGNSAKHKFEVQAAFE